MEGGIEAATPEAYEHSEMMLYKAQVLLEGGSCADALQLLDAVKVASFEDQCWYVNAVITQETSFQFSVLVTIVHMGPRHGSQASHGQHDLSNWLPG